jgi:plasmid stability protein
MAALQVRELPENLYHKLRQEADKTKRSLSQQAIITLAKGLDSDVTPKSRRQEVLAAIKKETGKIRSTVSDPVELVREDRER